MGNVIGRIKYALSERPVVGNANAGGSGEVSTTGERGDGEIMPGEPPKAWDRRLAAVISVVANPGYVALPTLLIVALSSAPCLGTGLLWWLVTVIGISGVPLLFIAQGVRSGRYSDRHLSRREHRVVPLLVSLVSVGATFAVLVLMQASRALLATIIAVLLGGVLALAITHGARWKISLHTGGITGTVTVFVLLFGTPALLLVPLIPMVAWARCRVRAHTLAQVIAAAVLALVVTVGVFRVLAVH